MEFDFRRMDFFWFFNKGFIDNINGRMDFYNKYVKKIFLRKLNLFDNIFKKNLRKLNGVVIIMIIFYL